MGINICRITERDMVVSQWSGGSATQIAIYPKDAKYSERDFIWRVSAATVDLEESDFTPLPDYERLIASTEGVMNISHGEGVHDKKTIIPRDTVHRFDGGAATHCVGRARDLNLMLRKGRCFGKLEFYGSEAKIDIDISEGETVLVYCLESNEAYVCEENGSLDSNSLNLKLGEDAAVFRIRLNLV